jgi:hypothetical protein
METLVENPGGAFQESFQYPLDLVASTIPQAPGSQFRTVYNSGSAAIKVGQWLRADVTGTTTHVYGVVSGAHGDTINQVLGIAADAIPVGGVGRMVVEGPAAGLAGAAGVSAGNLLSPSTVSTDDGQLVAASSPTAGQVIGVALATQATHAGYIPMWVFKV